MKSSIARGGSVWRVTLLPGTTLLHINRALQQGLRIRLMRSTFSPSQGDTLEQITMFKELFLVCKFYRSILVE